MQVIQKFLSLDHPNRPRRTNNPIAIIVHYTGNSNPTATALANINYAGRKYIRKDGKTYEANGTTPFVYGAGHVYVDENIAYQIVPYDEYVAGAGDARLPEDNGYKGQTKIAHEVFNHRQNYMSIQYEICNNGNWDKACDNAIEIIAKDMIDYKIPMERVYRHYDLSGKICPKPFVDNPQAWENFKTKLQNKIKEIKGDDNMPEIPQWKKDCADYLIKQGYLNSPHDPLEIIDIGTLGAILKNRDKKIKEILKQI